MGCGCRGDSGRGMGRTGAGAADSPLGLPERRSSLDDLYHAGRTTLPPGRAAQEVERPLRENDLRKAE